MDDKELQQLNEKLAKEDMQSTCNTDDLSGGVSDADANDKTDNG